MPPAPLVIILALTLAAAFVLLGFSIATLTADPTPSPEPLPLLTSLGSVDTVAEMDYLVSLCPMHEAAQWPVITNERELSKTVFNGGPNNPLDPRGLSALALSFGQFMDHEIVLSSEDHSRPNMQLAFNEYIDMSITHFAKRLNPVHGRPELNASRTPLIDASVVYGDAFSTPEELAAIRSEGDCRLRMSARGTLLPLDPSSARPGFAAGDKRNSEQAVLHVMHILFAREHNRLCDVLDLSPATRDWSEEDKFWKAREVLIAKQQHIVYTDWLPAILGSQTHLLDDTPMLHDTPRVAMEFAVAAGRWHTLVPHKIGEFNLTQLFFTYNMMVQHGPGTVLHALATSRAAAADLFIADDLREFLFGDYGLDLAAINLVRGREIGMGKYTELCECYSMQADESHGFEELHLALLAEPLVEGSSLPHSMAVVVAEQYRRLRELDPHFYTRDFESRFGPALQEEILGTTLRSLMLLHYPELELPPRSFFVS